MAGAVLLRPLTCVLQGRRALQATRDDGRAAPFTIALATPCGDPADWEVRIAQDKTGTWMPLCAEHNEHLRSVQHRPGAARVIDARRVPR